MKAKFYRLIILWIACNSAQGQVPTIQWQRSLGGTDHDQGKAICNTRDGNIVVAGEASSYDGDVTCHQGNFDIWILKLDTTGVVIWQQCLGGIGDERVFSIEQTSDGGFIIGGTADANSGIVSGVHGNLDDYWIVKTDSLGVFVWQKCYGGTDFDEVSSIHQTIDGGYIVVGSASSNNGDVIGHHGCNGCLADIWLLKLDTSGNILWQQIFGGSYIDYSGSVSEALDSGFIIAGYTASTDGDITNTHGSTDAWIIKTNGIGVLQWQKCYGGSLEESAYSIQATSDGSFIFVGEAKSNDGDVISAHLGGEAWLVKIDSIGNIIWQKSLGGNGAEAAYSISKTVDGGYFIVSLTASNDGDVSGHHGVADYWAVKTDSSGNIEWQKCLGGSDLEWAYQGIQTMDSGYAVIGWSDSNDGDVSGHHFPFQGNADDYWVVKLSSQATDVEEDFEIITGLNAYLNSNKNQLHIEFRANDKVKIQIQLLDITGRLLVTDDFSAMPGLNIRDVAIEKIHSGIYITRLVSEQWTLTGKVIKH
ncbi:MAG: T9SS type A sorting domain-containing protein [Bacteroidota bacterium]